MGETVLNLLKSLVSRFEKYNGDAFVLNFKRTLTQFCRFDKYNGDVFVLNFKGTLTQFCRFEKYNDVVFVLNLKKKV